MAVNTVQIPVGELKLGMFVCKLDRPWEGTPFLFQGFRIRKIEEIEKLREYCNSVLIDTDKSVRSTSSPKTDTRKEDAGKRRIYQLACSFEDEVRTANEIRHTTQETIDELFEDVARGNRIDLVRVKRIVHATVDGILRNPDAHVCLTQLKNRDEYTAQHSINVSVLALALGRHIGLRRGELEMLGIGALLHDIGKLKTPLEVLNKPDKLTPEEFDMMKAHPVHGRELLERRYGLPTMIADMAFSHHERIAGTGYPRGLKANEISFYSKIVSIVDVYDAITSDRCYHQGVSPTEALTRMYGWRLTDFDGELLEQFIQCMGIYPVGTLVELTSGEVGVVISVNPVARLRPKVNLVLDGNKQPYFPARIVDLAAYADEDGAATYAIHHVLMPDAYGIDIKAHLTDIQRAKDKHQFPPAM